MALQDQACDNGRIQYKARFVRKGFKVGVYYEGMFAPIAKYTSIRAVMSLVSIMGWRIHQMDVNTTFLHGIIEEEVYIEQPQGFEVNWGEVPCLHAEKHLVWTQAGTIGMVF